MRCFITAIALITALYTSAFAQEENPFANILKAPSKIKLADNDNKQTALLKQSYNAIHAEIRTRYNYWLQGIGDLDGLLNSIDRFQLLRVEMEAKPDARRFAEQKVSFAREIETQTESTKLHAQRFEAHREIDKRAATSYRIAAELELERLTKSEGGLRGGGQAKVESSVPESPK